MLTEKLRPPSPQPCSALPVPPQPYSHSHPATFPGNQCHQCQRGCGEENESTSNAQPSWYRREPPGHPTIVIPRLQISDLTLYPFWFSSGLILSGCEQRQRQFRNSDGPMCSACTQGSPTSDGSFMVAGQDHLAHATSLLPWLSQGQIWSHSLASKGR